MMLAKPAELFDRDDEWADLSSFACGQEPGARLALVYGRRRQGKTLLLELLSEATNGFLFTGAEQSDAQNLADLSAAFTRHTRAHYPVRFSSWVEAVDALLRLGEERDEPVTVVLDEFPYLLAQNAAIASHLQNALSPRGRARRASRTRLVVCGSALTTMRGLLAGSAPLRGRASTELVVRSFDYREVAGFWGLSGQWEVAARLDALVGGTPAYRDFCDGDAPADASDLDGWVVRNLLNPSSAMFREGRILLAEEPDITAPALYFAVLGAIARGRTRRGEIASEIGREPGALHHPLSVLTDTGLIEAHDDAFRAKRATFHLAEPVLRLYQLVIRPHEARLALRRGARVWAEVADTVAARIYGPHFEHLARRWALVHASAGTLGGTASRVQPAVVRCGNAGCQAPSHEIDVVVTQADPGRSDSVLAIGEAKWRSRPVGMAELDRLRHVRALLPMTTRAAPKLLLFSRTGFTEPLRQEQGALGDVELIDLDRLYTGS